jgi:hypothetical protein
MRATREVFDRAKRVYESATASYWVQRDNGGIAPLDMSLSEDAEEHAKGVRFKCTTPAARIVLGAWQKAKAELDAASDAIRLEAGDNECRVCPVGKGLRSIPPRDPEPDRRLPREAEDVA